MLYSLRNDSLEVNSETQLDDCASSSGDDHMDVNALNEELSMICEQIISKFEVLNNRSSKLKEENENLFSTLNIVIQERMRF